MVTIHSERNTTTTTATLITTTIIIILPLYGIHHIRARLGESLKTKWQNKVLHGQYIRSLDRQLISEEDTFLWLSEGDLKAKTESEIVAAQDQALQTKYYATKILNTETDSKCRLYQQCDETIEHNISMPNIGKRTVHKET
jgi:hypothetical protein